MARKSKKKKQSGSFFDDISPQTKQAIGAVLCVALGIFFVLSALHSAGPAGEMTYRALAYLFGAGYVLAPIGCALGVYILLGPDDGERVSIAKLIGAAILLLAILGGIGLYDVTLGGVVGKAIQYPFGSFFGTTAAAIVLGAIACIGFFLTFDTGLVLPQLFNRARDESEESEEYYEAEIPLPESSEGDAESGAKEDEDAGERPHSEPSGKKTVRARLGFTGQALAMSFNGAYEPPPISLLSKDSGKARVGDVKASSNIIKRTLQNFHIEVEMDEVSIGPTVTRYALKPAEGVRISKIVGLQNNLELALAASPIRIEAPIPGKSLVGIEVPNTQKATVGLAALLASPEYTDSPKPLLVALGRDITGKAHFANIAKMPHVLIAGTTGSGKSVMIHSLVVSLLFRNSPEQLRFIMIDPKRVELTLYNDIPHLLTPVITDAKKAILSLKWAIKEMERRYDILQTEKVRDIGSYHEKIYQPAKAAFEKKGSPEEEKEDMPEPLPYILVVIDELADLMSAYPRELEASIVRLAQMSRAVGIHLVLSTQRPSVNVITGLIKANIPGRIALQVASQIDSRTILDTVGAEKLLGQGDMLYLSAELAKPLRLQNAYISEEELKNVVGYLAKQTDLQALDSIDLDGGGREAGSDAIFSSGFDDDTDEDDLYDEARAAVLEAGKASTSYLQRKFRIGYSRAARLIDMLEDRGIIGPQDGSKPREVYRDSAGGAEDNDGED
jgi:S-DNA-T family DNA segregation ATPase FtsK/SpoIIIE